MDIGSLNRAELAALVVETLANAGIDVVLVGGSCVCIYTNERFASLDLDFVDLTYARRAKIAQVLATLGFSSRGSSRYFESPDCPWALEFPSAPLAIGHQKITDDSISKLETSQGTVRLLSPTDCIKDRLLWYYLEQDGQCWKQALDVARAHKVAWADLKQWHTNEGFEANFAIFRKEAR